MDGIENSKVCQECACSCLVDRFICSVEGHWHVFAVVESVGDLPAEQVQASGATNVVAGCQCWGTMLGCNDVKFSSALLCIATVGLVLSPVLLYPSLLPAGCFDPNSFQTKTR